MERGQQSATGIPVDRSGGPTIDPTANVIALVIAAIQRQDDLRDAADKYAAAETARVQEICLLQAAHANELSILRSVHLKETIETESKRLDAIHQVSVLAAAGTARDALTAIQTLAAKQAADEANARSERVREMDGLGKRLSLLEQSSYEGKGRQAYSDPILAEVSSGLKELSKSLAGTVGKTEGIDKTWGIILAVVAAAGVLWGAYEASKVQVVLPVPQTQVGK